MFDEKWSRPENSRPVAGLAGVWDGRGGVSRCLAPDHLFSSFKKKLDNRDNAGTLQDRIGEKSLIAPRCQEPTWRVTPFPDVASSDFPLTLRDS